MWSLSSQNRSSNSAPVSHGSMPDAIDRRPGSIFFVEQTGSSSMASRTSTDVERIEAASLTGGKYNRGERHSPHENVKSRNSRLGLISQFGSSDSDSNSVPSGTMEKRVKTWGGTSSTRQLTRTLKSADQKKETTPMSRKSILRKMKIVRRKREKSFDPTKE